LGVAESSGEHRRQLATLTSDEARSPLAQERPMPYRIAGIDVHKKILALVVADVEIEGDDEFERHTVGTSPRELRDPWRPIATINAVGCTAA
jgi:hypothetical protein